MYEHEVRMDKTSDRECKSCRKIKPLAGFHKNGRGDWHGICAVCRNERRKTWDESSRSNPDRIFKKYKRCARKRGLDFDISEKDFYSFKDSSCHYCGSKLNQIRLDRVDNNAGYNIDNVVSCCTLCNFFKHTLGKKEFLEHVDKIYIYQKEE